MSAQLPRVIQVPIPKIMRTLEKDLRGYPIPWIVLRDITGTPMFTINDVTKVEKCRSKFLCAICGKRMRDGYWFVGGSRAFLHEHGAFVDPPNHLECATYALMVCPFLAARKYSGYIDDKKLDPAKKPEGLSLVRVETMYPGLPERFGLGLTYDYENIYRRLGDTICMVDDWKYVEWWRAGERINAPDTGVSPP